MNDEIEDRILDEIINDEYTNEEVGENGEHDCLDGTDGTGNIDADGICITCKLTGLI